MTHENPPGADLDATGPATAPTGPDGTAGATLSPFRRGAAQVLRALAIVGVVAVVVQFVLAGLGAFGESFDPHRVLGTSIGALTLVMLIVALIARPSRGAVIVSVILAVAAVGQGFLAVLGDDTNTAFGGAHALNALLIGALMGRMIAMAVPPLSAAPRQLAPAR